MEVDRNLTTTKRLTEILSGSPIPLSLKDLGVRLRLSHYGLADYQISALLRGMLREGRVELKNGRWLITPLSERNIGSSRYFKLIQPSLSPEALSCLDRAPRKLSDGTAEGNTKEAQPLPSSDRWATFRKLVAYYKQCIRNEEGADASAFQNEIGKRFIYLRKIGSWYPRPGVHWRSTIALGPHLSPLLNSIPASGDEDALVVGYPVQAFYKEKQDEPDVVIIRPVFYFPVEKAISHEGLVISCEDPRPEVNLGWLEYAFSRNSDRQRNFLSACGFINPWQPSDEIPGFERGELALSLDNLVSALSAFLYERVRQPLDLRNVPDEPLHEPFETGLYNRAVLMLAKRTRFTVNLLRELSVIEKAPDEVLERTALIHIFASKKSPTTPRTEEPLHEAVVADTTTLNAEQRRATASLLTQDITVVTGPPGTGKSQVVSGTVANARLKGKTVLFASRNHKAIDAVIGRLSSAEGQSLIVRTNSKVDPNFRFTFSEAIKDMLAQEPDLTSRERFRHSSSELESLLADRGETARAALSSAENGTKLGYLVERISYLSREIPEELVAFLEAEPSRFPAKGFQDISPSVEGLYLRYLKNGLYNKLLSKLRLLLLLPAYMGVISKLRQLPSLSSLPLIIGTNDLKTIIQQFQGLKKVAEFVRLQKECRPYEMELQRLPSIEKITEDIARINERIAKVASLAIDLDQACRRGIPFGVDREELSGLRAALRATGTGLDEGEIRAETIRVLQKLTSSILKAFPCWAVTNLSLGSRIPLVPAMFDLAIVDEASQSDIPSAIPILYRARRAGVVGDPWQLTHTSKLTTARDTILRRQIGLKRVEDVRFAYTESSLYDLFAGTQGVEPVFLSETYRSAAEIAGYSDLVFYNGRLRVATDPNRLVTPQGMSPGIYWTEINGEIQSGGGSGCYCQDEVREVVRIMRAMLTDGGFRGTVGVITPFRHQANRLRDALFESDTKFYDALLRANTHVDTAHGFQGDERDVVLFSLCGGPGMPGGSRSFLRETGNLFNVAVGRARAVLHVIGNREWAKRCGINHIEKLASPLNKLSSISLPGPWHPHESPWEEKLYDALLEAGLEPRPQFKVSSRRLDLALIGDGSKPLKIDIEVDGDCHRNPDGTRKIDDLWRDIQIRGMGWKVVRFWTYQLREDMQGCVKKIHAIWSENE